VSFNTFALTVNRDHIFAPFSMPGSAPLTSQAGRSCQTETFFWALCWIAALAYKYE